MMTSVQAEADVTTPSDGAIQVLADQLRGQVIRAGDAEYDAARAIFNAMIDRKPALIARCATADDVVAAVTFAREQNMLVSIKGGGHNVAGNAVCDGGLVIDLSSMKGIQVDPAARTVRAEGGVLWQEFDAATQEHGLATTGGAVSTTGIAGLTLGGGIGFLVRRFGLASDNLLAVEIVTADGQVRTASASEHPDLFWGVRGGGGNFGVVTEFTYRLHPVGPTVMGGLLIHPFERARDVFTFYRDFAPTAPDELTVIPGMLTGPDGNRIVAFVVCYSGPLEESERVLGPLRGFGPPVADLLAPMPYTSVQQLFDPAYPAGRRNYWKSSFVDDFSDAAIDTLIEWFAKVPSPWTAAAFEHLGGRVSRINADATAFSQRGARYNFLITSGWADPAEDEANIRWTRDFWQAMQPHARAAAYVNYLAAEEQDRIAAAYGDKYERMVALKTTYDPTNLFRMNQNIKPVG
jgi:FAD/FMN-containing dehydrogenase